MYAITNRSNDGARATVRDGYRPPDGKIVYSPTEETFQSILDNDPGIAGVLFHCTDDLVELAGRAFSQSIHLRTLQFYLPLLTDFPEMLSSFLKRLAENRSVEHLSISGIHCVDFITILAPFFTFNRNLRCIEINNCAEISTGIPSLISVVNSSREWRLERIQLFSCRIGDECTRDLIDACNNSPGLCHLRELCLSSNQVGQLGCTAIGKLLKNSECTVRTLLLVDNELNDKCINILVDAFIVNGTLKHVALENQKFVTSAGWCLFSAYVSHPSCSWGEVHFRDNDVLNDAALSILGMTLAVNKTVTWVSIRRVSLDTTVFGWSGFSTCLRCPESILKVLILDQCSINDEGAVVLAKALSENTSLKHLSMSNNHSISSSCWVDCLNLLLGPNSKWLYLDLSANNVDDAGAELVALRLENSTLRGLDLKHCPNITAVGFRAIAGALRSSTIQHLLLGHPWVVVDDTNEDALDDIMICFAEALKFNSSLELLRGFRTSDIGCSALANALCDTSSIENTFISNHTLFTLLNTPSNERLVELLRMNTGRNKASVVREKIIKYHFNDVENCAQVFGSMEMKLLPTALSWIGRDNHGYSLMYNFSRSMPWLMLQQQPIQVVFGRS
jgi:hypothetical protein